MERNYRLSFNEVAVLLLVGGLLAAVLIGFSARRAWASPRSECAANLHQLGLALIQYAQDNQNHYPHATADGFLVDADGDPAVPVDGGPTALLQLLGEYVVDEARFQCPAAEPGPGEKTSYGYDPRHLNTHPPSVAIVADRPPDADPTNPGAVSKNHGWGRMNVLFIDCHAEMKTTAACGYADDDIFRDNTGEDIGGNSDNRRDSCILGYGGEIAP